MNTTLAEAWHEKEKRAARSQLLPFIDYCFDGDYEIAWHNQLITSIIDRWLGDQGLPNLILMMPPRHGKSEIVSRNLPGHIFGRWPDKSIIAVSYNVILSGAMSRDAQRVMVGDKYAEVFPETRLAGTSRKQVRGVAVSQTVTEFQVVGRRGRYLAAGVGSGITGRGADFGIIDDPFKDRAEAESPTIREKVWNWYVSTFRTRLEKGAKQILLMTRWHQNDLAGRLIKQMENEPDADQWDIISLPAIYEPGKYNHPEDKRADGEALWQGKYNEPALKQTKATIGSYDWHSLYQQKPTPPEGAIVKRSWFNIIEYEPPGLYWVRFWDLAVTADPKADWTAGISMAYDERGMFYLKGMIRGQWIWPDAKKIIVAAILSQLDMPVGVEAQGTQKGLVDDLIIDPALVNANIQGYNVSENKLSRALVWFAKLEAGRILLIKGAWNDDFIDEVVSFKGISGDTDDQVDCVSGAYAMLKQCYSPSWEEVGTYG